MGIILGKLRKKKTTYEILETLDKEIKNIEEYRRNTEQTHKRIVGRFIVISVGIYLVVSFLFYFYFFPATFYDRLFYIIPLILAPVIILTVKKALTWYYKWKINRKQNKLGTLRDEKKKMLEKVMDTETYKVAKTILEKFGTEPIITTVSIRKNIPPDVGTPMKQAITTPAMSGLRHRTLPALNQQLTSLSPARPISTSTESIAVRQAQTMPRNIPTPGIPSITSGMLASTPLPMPRPILPRERSVFDKMVDYLVGDGPSNRYALICKSCFSHNGMVFREEFDYISFRCCYCFTFNPARKKRPAVPKLEIDHTRTQSDTSESEKHSPSDTDSESETLAALKVSQNKNILDQTEVTEKEEPQDVGQLEPHPLPNFEIDELRTNTSNNKEVTEEEQIKNEQVNEDDGVDLLKD